MTATLRFAEGDADYESIYRLRYDIYVEEMGYRFPGVDDAGRRLVERFDRPTRLLMAEEGGELVGTVQFNLGRECTFTEEERKVYRLQDFASVAGPHDIMIACRFMTRPDRRDSDLPARLLDGMFGFALDHDMRLVFGDCRPHLINNYLRLGFRNYAGTYNDPVAGMLAPLIFVLDDVAHLRRIGSRMLPLLEGRTNRTPRPDFVSRLLALLPQATPVRLLSSPAGAPDWSGLRSALAENSNGHVSIFQGLEPQEIARLVEMSPIITCAPGDRIINQDSAEHSVFVVLEGAVEVVRDGRHVALMTRGEVFGEIAFLLGGDRTADVLATTQAKVIALRERALNDLIASESKIAARFLLNLARIACLKLTGDTDVPPTSQAK